MNTLENQINEAVREITSVIYSMPNRKNPDLREYAIPQVIIKAIVPEQSGPSIAKLGVTVIKKPMIHRINYRDSDGAITQTKTASFEDWYSYWMAGVNPQLIGEGTLTEKAIILQEFLANTCNNFPDNPQKDKLCELALKLHDKIAGASRALDEREYYMVRADTIKIEVDESPMPNSMQTINLRRAIHVNPDSYAKLKKHEEEGKFDKGIPFELDIVVYATLE